ncbi:MAG: ABC transporter permease [Lachnospiraceae bacterium]|nr:ABC transporter permease [Lachnospiraceae bacterium]
MSGKEKERSRTKGGGRFLCMWLMRAVCAGALIWLSLEGMRYAAAFDRSRGLCVVRLSQEVSAEKIRAMREDWEAENEEEPFPAVFWQEQKGVRIRNEAWNRDVSVTELLVCGSSGLLFPGQAFLAAEDTAGCLIDRETSWQLFGDASAVGSMVEFEGETYQVCGVLQESAPVFVHTAQEDGAFSCLALREGKGQNLWDRLQSKSGLSGRRSVCFQWDWRWLKSEGAAGEKIREILYGENNVLEIRYLEQIAAMAAAIAAATVAAFAVVLTWKREGSSAGI